jgi:hypothetical protein
MVLVAVEVVAMPPRDASFSCAVLETFAMADGQGRVRRVAPVDGGLGPAGRTPPPVGLSRQRSASYDDGSSGPLL